MYVKYNVFGMTKYGLESVIHSASDHLISLHECFTGVKRI